MEDTGLLQGLISATSESEATAILNTLTKRKLVAGGLITEGASQYWWEGTLTKKNYFNISIFTRYELANKIITEVEKIHSDQTPIVIFSDIRIANQKFCEWVLQCTSAPI